MTAPKTESKSGNSTFKKLTVERSLNTVVVNQTLALRMNICGENSQLLMAAIRGVT